MVNESNKVSSVIARTSTAPFENESVDIVAKMTALFVSVREVVEELKMTNGYENDSLRYLMSIYLEIRDSLFSAGHLKYSDEYLMPAVGFVQRLSDVYEVLKNLFADSDVNEQFGLIDRALSQKAEVDSLWLQREAVREESCESVFFAGLDCELLADYSLAGGGVVVDEALRTQREFDASNSLLGVIVGIYSKIAEANEDKIRGCVNRVRGIFDFAALPEPVRPEVSRPGFIQPVMALSPLPIVHERSRAAAGVKNWLGAAVTGVIVAIGVRQFYDSLGPVQGAEDPDSLRAKVGELAEDALVPEQLPVSEVAEPMVFDVDVIEPVESEPVESELRAAECEVAPGVRGGIVKERGWVEGQDLSDALLIATQ